MKTTKKLFLTITVTTLVSLCLGKMEPARATLNDKLPEQLEFSVEEINNNGKTISFDGEESIINQILGFDVEQNQIIINFFFFNILILVTLLMLELLLIIEEELWSSWE